MITIAYQSANSVMYTLFSGMWIANRGTYTNGEGRAITRQTGNPKTDIKPCYNPDFRSNFSCLCC
jgi:hypothetical protein